MYNHFDHFKNNRGAIMSCRISFEKCLIKKGATINGITITEDLTLNNKILEVKDGVVKIRNKPKGSINLPKKEVPMKDITNTAVNE